MSSQSKYAEVTQRAFADLASQLFHAPEMHDLRISQEQKQGQEAFSAVLLCERVFGANPGVA